MNKVEMPTEKILKYNTTSYKNKDLVIRVYYFDQPTWNKEKQRGESKRICIGREDPKTKKLVPNYNYFKVFNITPPNEDEENDLSKGFEILNFGDFYMIDKLAQDLGLKEIIKDIFGDSSQEILFNVHSIIRNGNVIKNIEAWRRDCYSYISNNENYSNQRVSELFATIDENKRSRFFAKWITLSKDTESTAYDVTSISSYSDNLSLVEYGYNRDHEDLPQLNLAVLFGQKTKLPLYYEVYKGSINDKSFLEKFIHHATILGIKPKRYVMDRGFYTISNLKWLEDNNINYLMCVQSSYRFVQDELKNLPALSQSFLYRVKKYKMWGKKIQIEGKRFLYVFMNEFRKNLKLTNWKLKLKKYK
jgi:transposase